MKHVAAMGVLFVSALAVTSGAASAADRVMLERVHHRMALAAAPWCDPSTELGADGQRRCVLRVKVVEDAVARQANAALMFNGVVLTQSMLERLDEAELAVVLGHEIAHLALGHARRRLAAPAHALPPERRRSLALLDDWLKSSLPEGHADTPADPREQELDADALGLLLAMRAGYPAAAGGRLFQRAATALPGWEAAESATHPAPAERGQALRRRAERWCELLAAGEPLVPAEARLLPAAEYRRAEARDSPSARPDASVCAATTAAEGAHSAQAPWRAATSFAQPFTLGRHAPSGPCPHCEPR